ncbi:MAG: EamA family transporter RarD [Pseudomonadota bacterium]
MRSSSALQSSLAPQPVTRHGLASGLVAYLMWGLLPIYFILIEHVRPQEVLAHRIVWAIPLGAAILLVRKQWGAVFAALTSVRTLSLLLCSASLIAVNWFVYIVAVQNEQVFQASLGYYINPLVNVAAGMLLFGETLRRMQLVAVFVAAIGVAVLTVSGGELPWISLVLAASFALYGIIRKQISVGAMPGLFVETLFLVPAAAVYLWLLYRSGAAAFGSSTLAFDLLLFASGPLTVLPLLFFALAARGMPLSVLGMLQFIAPTLQFLVGLAYGESLTAAHIVCFSLIWIAIVMFASDAWYNGRRPVAAAGRPADSHSG